MLIYPEVVVQKQSSRSSRALQAGNHLCRSLFFNKVAGLRPSVCNLLKEESRVLIFSFEFCKIFKNSYFKDTYGRVLLHIQRNFQDD